MSLRDDKYNLEYKWFDGSEFDYSNLDSEKPTRYGRKHWAVMNHNGKESGFPTIVEIICGGIRSARSKQTI